MVFYIGSRHGWRNSGDDTQNASLAPRPLKMNTDNHPIRDEIDHENVEYDKIARSYRHDSDGLHSRENTPVVRRSLAVTSGYAH
jgi:hypothetical protein